jgi:PiT family inorganic phosphate transporter
MDRWFRRLQLVSAGIFSYNHGTNDAQRSRVISVILRHRLGGPRLDR